jgi:nuclear pore complex protein Nup62
MSAPALSLFGATSAEKKDGAAATTTSTAPATTSTAVATQPPSVLRGKTVDEIVTKWATELDGHVRDFNSYAGEVAAWDRALIQNGNNVSPAAFIPCL